MGVCGPDSKRNNYYKILINENITKNICKIKNNDDKFNLGFFCTIPMSKEKENILLSVPILITDYPIKKEDIINNNKILVFYINNKKHEIQIDDSRFIYKNKEYNIMIIEIKKNDCLNINKYLEIENNNDIDDYKTQKLKYIYFYIDANENIHYILDDITISENNYRLNYKCDIKFTIIINRSNLKVIGVSFQNSKQKNIYQRFLLKEIINDFNKCYIFFYILKSLIFFFVSIENLNSYFSTNSNFHQIENNNILKFIHKYVIYFNNKDLEQMNNTIKKIEKAIIDKTDLEDLTFGQLMKLMLNNIFTELNTKKVNNQENLDYADDNDTAYNNFKKFFLEQNKSIIKELFYGIKKKTIYYECCNILKYKYIQYKFIFVNCQNDKNPNNIQSIINEWKKQKKSKLKCDKCLNVVEILETYELYTFPEILIIILSQNINKITINLNSKIKINNDEYEIIYCIISDKVVKTNFNIIYKKNNSFFVRNEYTDIKEFTYKEQSHNLYPLVLFYKKINKNDIINKNDDNINTTNNSSLILFI